MLELRLHPGADGTNWRATAQGYAADAGCISPFLNPALESFAVASPTDFLVVVRERSSGTPSVDAITVVAPYRLEEVDADVHRWPLQHVTVRVGPHGATIRSGSWGTAPLFVTVADGTLLGHWDARSLLPRLSSHALDPILAAHYLATFDTPYASRTLLRELHLLTERSCATWSSTGERSGTLDIQYPPAIAQQSPRRLRSGADVPAMFQTILEASIRRYLSSDIAAGSELSGGLDSAIVSGVAARISGGGWRTCGILLPDAIPSGQLERRREMIDRWAYDDTTVELSAALPLSDSSRSYDGIHVMPWEECYHEAVDAMLATASRNGVALMLTGFGGDELCSLAPWESADCIQPSGDSCYRADADMPTFLSERSRQAVLDTLGRLEEAPAGHASASAIESVAFSSPLYLRRGIWPVHPLCSPELVRFCASLPAEWRADRAVERSVLQAMGYTRRVTHGPTDSFAGALALALRTTARPMVEALFRNSRLADAGHVNGAELQTRFVAWARSDGELDRAVHFFAAAVLELTMSSLDGCA